MIAAENQEVAAVVKERFHELPGKVLMDSNDFLLQNFPQKMNLEWYLVKGTFC
jgi:hypothetical protein